MKVLDERPCNVADVFEDYSRETKQSKLHVREDTIQDKPERTTEVELAELQQKLFSVSAE